MIITCPECTTKFNLNDELMPPSGRKLRCSKCKHEWFQTNDNLKKPDIKTNKIKLENNIDIDQFIKDDSNIKTNIKTAPDNIIIPKEEGNISFKFPIFAIFILFICLSIFYREKLFGDKCSLDFLYNMIGYENTNNVIFEEMKITKQYHTDKTQLLLKGKIRNNSDRTLKNLFLRIILKDKDGNILAKQVLPYTGSEVIEPNQLLNVNYPMEIYLNQELLHFVELDIASKFEFIAGLR